MELEDTLEEQIIEAAINGDVDFVKEHINDEGVEIDFDKSYHNPLCPCNANAPIYNILTTNQDDDGNKVKNAENYELIIDLMEEKQEKQNFKKYLDKQINKTKASIKRSKRNIKNIESMNEDERNKNKKLLEERTRLLEAKNEEFNRLILLQTELGKKVNSKNNLRDIRESLIDGEKKYRSEYSSILKSISQAKREISQNEISFQLK